VRQRSREEDTETSENEEFTVWSVKPERQKGVGRPTRRKEDDVEGGKEELGLKGAMRCIDCERDHRG